MHLSVIKAFITHGPASRLLCCLFFRVSLSLSPSPVPVAGALSAGELLLTAHTEQHVEAAEALGLGMASLTLYTFLPLAHSGTGALVLSACRR